MKCLSTATIFNLNNFPQLKPLSARLILALVLFFAVGATAETTNALSGVEIKGRELAQQLISARPETNVNLSGLMKIKDGQGNSFQFYIALSTFITNPLIVSNGWASSYSFGNNTNLNGPLNINPKNQYDNGSLSGVFICHFDSNAFAIKYKTYRIQLTGSGVGDYSIAQLNDPWVSVFTNSDFWIADLGLEFFHWPAQKTLPKTTNLKRGREYTLLESTNPNPPTNGYSRVLSWIDKESGGILQAEAYDAKGKLLKVFEPKSFKKVNGQWELQEMEIRNVQTGSRTRLEFDLKKNGE